MAAKVLSAWLSVQSIFCFAAIRENCEEEKSIREIGNCDLNGDVGRPGLRYEIPKEIRFLFSDEIHDRVPFSPVSMRLIDEIV